MTDRMIIDEAGWSAQGWDVHPTNGNRPLRQPHVGGLWRACRRVHARAAFAIYTQARTGGGLPLLGLAVLLGGGLLGAAVDQAMQVIGREDPERALGLATGLAIAVAWIAFAAVAGNGYGPDDR
jgi:hypothetical protein